MSNKIATLDGVRGLALLNVLILHATGLFFPSINSSLSGTAQFGVWLFFVLSSFLLTNRFFVTGFSLRSLISYFLGRALRILPVFFLAVYVYYYAGLFNEDTLQKIVSFSGSYAHFWTIPVEFLFYFILPFIAYAAITLGNRYGVMASVAFLVVVLSVCQIFYPYTDLRLAGKVLWYIPVFISGMIVSCLFMKGRRPKVNGFTSDLICVCIILSCVSVAPRVVGIFGVESSFLITNKFMFFSPLLGVMVFLLCDGKGAIGWLMKTKAMTHIGKWSFSIYLWHLLILFRIAPFNHDNVVVYVVSIVACIGFGAISFYAIEEPCENIRHRIMAFINAVKLNTKQNA